MLESPEQRGGVEHPQPCRSKLEGERQPVEPPADLLRALVGHEVATDRASSLHEQLDGVVFRQWIDRILTLALDPQWRPAGRENLDGLPEASSPATSPAASSRCSKLS